MSQQRIEAELKLEVKNVATFHNFVATQNERMNDKCCDIMVIGRQNFITTMENYAATLIKKLVKKNVEILFCSVATMIKQMVVEFCLNNLFFFLT